MTTHSEESPMTTDRTTAENAPEHLDCIVVGAGLSGIDAAYHVTKAFPERSLAVLEARDSLGGTWDLFRYPGVRSDSDMFTLGFSWKPWTGKKAIADGADILDYLREAADENGITERIRFGHKVVRANYVSDEGRWHVTAQRTDTGEEVELTANFVVATTGYYRYDEGFTPEFAGRDEFTGEVLHPQHWPQDFDATGKRVVVIGSGATAVTLVPALAKAGAAQVTMLQRTPSYILSAPDESPLAPLLRRLPEKTASKIIRAQYATVSIGLYEFCRKFPDRSRSILRSMVAKQLPDSIDVDEHFRPPYDPWDQRLCLVPRGDLFRALRRGDADIVTDHIDRFTPNGILLKSGREIEADVIVTATGLNLLAVGGVQASIDGEPVDVPSTMVYKGMMLSDIPNFAFIVGYTNASWTLKADLVCSYLVRIMEHLRDTGTSVVVPRRTPGVKEEPFLDFAAGYVLRSLNEFPKQGDVEPWRLKMNWFKDRKVFAQPVDDGTLEFTTPAPSSTSLHEARERESLPV